MLTPIPGSLCRGTSGTTCFSLPSPPPSLRDLLQPSLQFDFAMQFNPLKAIPPFPSNCPTPARKESPRQLGLLCVDSVSPAALAPRDSMSMFYPPALRAPPAIWFYPRNIITLRCLPRHSTRLHSTLPHQGSGRGLSAGSELTYAIHECNSMSWAVMPGPSLFRQHSIHLFLN